MTVKPTETPSQFIKDFIIVKPDTLYDTILVYVSCQKECVKESQYAY